MKRFIVLFFSVLCVSFAFCNDIIVTKSSKRIEAKITEIGEKEIKYKTINNLNGPLYVLSTSEIVTILLENGEVKLYNDDEAQLDNLSELIDNQEITPRIERMGSSYALYEGDRITIMNKAEFPSFAQQHCPAAYEHFQKGLTLKKVGFGLLGSGIGLAYFVGIPLLRVGLRNEETILHSVNGGEMRFYNHQASVFSDCGGVFLFVGHVVAAASIPCLIVGKVKRNNAHNLCNEEWRNKRVRTPLTFSLTTGANGMGIAMNF